MTLAETLRLAGTEPLDAAVLDVNLQGEPVFPAAATLAARGVKVVLATGYSEVPEAAGLAVRVLRKPVAPAELAAALGAAMAAPQDVPKPA
jgi:CheY-like chemotaxis protein